MNKPSPLRLRRSKIVATLGPATDNPNVLRAVIAAGMDVARLNYSHGNHAEQTKRAQLVREIAKELGKDVAILADLQGPKIRIERFSTGSIELSEGDPFTLDAGHEEDNGTAQVVGCAYKELSQDVKAGDVLLLNDGAIVLNVNSIDGLKVHTTVEVGGKLSDRKGINRQGGGLSADALTEKDLADLIHAVNLDVDVIAVSFPREAADMQRARKLVEEAGGKQYLCAKIERAEALDVLEEIIAASDIVMVARGDLGVEIGDAELPGWQKRIIRASREQNKLVITATQMMESMISSPIPTRAEVLDVANAIMDGTDAVMLSGETAVGKYPLKVVQAMARVCEGAESVEVPTRSRAKFKTHFVKTDEAIAMAAAWTASNMQARAIVSLTESGSTALLLSRVETRTPIFALTQHEKTRRRMALCRGVYPLAFLPTALDTLKPTEEALDLLLDRGILQSGDRVLLTKGDFTGPGGTNAMKILLVP